MAVLIPQQTAAIFSAQFRSMWNYGFRRGGFARALTGVFSLVWYVMWAFLAWTAFSLCRDPVTFTEFVAPILGALLLGMTAYWQVVPIMTASAGLSLDIPRLSVYPVPHRQLFIVDALLRLSTSIEMVLVTAGLFLGLILNPRIFALLPFVLFLFAAFNVMLSAGIRDLLVRVMARRGIREMLILLFVLGTMLPQTFIVLGVERGPWLQVLKAGGPEWLPWAATARILTGTGDIRAWVVDIIAVAVAWIFARTQFERSLKFDESAATAQTRSEKRSSVGAFEWPERLLPSPVGTLVSKELRTLIRAPRFRLLFIMGFTFGLLIWLPMVMRASASSPMRSNYLAMVSAYAILLLGEPLFWNNLGMDRSAAQNYFVIPVRFRAVLLAKNCAAVIFITLELVIVAVACKLLRFPVGGREVLEAFAISSLLSFFLLSAGNLLSMYAPKAINPVKAWRTSTGQTQAWLILVYPLASLPVLLAYGARYAFRTDLAFWSVILVDYVGAAIFYVIALDSAEEMAIRRREEIVHLLSNAESPVAG